jgi:hypothetical protein
VVNSRFRITTSTVLAGLLNEAPQAIGPSKSGVPTEPVVQGPPAIRAAIDGGQDVSLPIIVR